MKNLRVKVWILAIMLAMTAVLTPTALAAEAEETDKSSFLDDVKEAGSSLYQSAKEKAPGWWQSVKEAGSNAIDTVKEHGPEWVEKGKEKGSELINKGKDVLQEAGDKVSGFLDDQENQFWERTEQQIYGGTSDPGAEPPTSPSESNPTDGDPGATDNSPAGPSESDSASAENGNAGNSSDAASSAKPDGGIKIAVDEPAPSAPVPAEPQPNETVPEHEGNDLQSQSSLTLILVIALCSVGFLVAMGFAAYGFYLLGRRSRR